MNWLAIALIVFVAFSWLMTLALCRAARLGDEQAARNLFEKYEMCSKIYSRQWQQGKSIEQLTVAG